MRCSTLAGSTKKGRSLPDTDRLLAQDQCGMAGSRLVEVRPARSPVARAGGCSVGVVCRHRRALSLSRALPHFLAER